ncbi:hypothetical protein GA0115233_100941 [Streptomyces sp. DI166]|uniref:hypothetical protein n=1 Tax=Streptomyces sp. DI166 TaxID=1839783 RepID=UPI0007F37DEA|nr:hypothetical protein [Streptomyces sp. DI166]SBT89394.1 hypothetical protein GA0115233_100941 [Streptomyces sp. DI166]
MTDTVWIRSATNPADGRAACLLQWGPVHALLEPDTVLNTARDLMAAAAHAESDIALIRVFRTRLKLDMTTIGHMVRAIRAERPAPTGKTALRIEAVAGAKTGLPYVHVARGSMKGELSPDEARAMAGHWTQAAVAAQIDVRLRYVLGEYPQLTPHDIGSIFSQLQEVQR